MEETPGEPSNYRPVLFVPNDGKPHTLVCPDSQNHHAFENVTGEHRYCIEMITDFSYMVSTEISAKEKQ